MAGLRVGLAFASEEVISLFARVKYPYNLSCLTQRVAEEQLAQPIAQHLAQIRTERASLARALAACPCVERVYPSDANFLLVRTAAPDALYQALVGKGVIVRNRSRIAGCEGCLRITVGLPKENLRVLDVVKNFSL